MCYVVYAFIHSIKLEIGQQFVVSQLFFVAHGGDERVESRLQGGEGVKEE